MIRYIFSRIVIAFVLLLGLISLSFGLVSLMPGSPAVALLGDYVTPEDVARINAQLGLDKPFWERYVDYVARTLRGDLGTSFFTGSSVSEEMLRRLPATLVYLVPGMVLSVVIGMTLGSIAAYKVGRSADRAFTATVTVLMAVPEFVLALLLLFVFYQQLQIAPAPLGMLSSADVRPPNITGSVPIDAILAGEWGTVGAIFSRAGLLIATLGLFFAAYFGKTVRTGLIQALNSPQVEFAKACGLRPHQVYRYALTDIRGPLMTYMVLIFAANLSGAAIVEGVFGWPGIGGWSLNGVLNGDVPVIQGFVLVMGTASLFGYVILDSLVTILDPRARSAAIKSKGLSRRLRREAAEA